jgi:hypothetical protein
MDSFNFNKKTNTFSPKEKTKAELAKEKHKRELARDMAENKRAKEEYDLWILKNKENEERHEALKEEIKEFTFNQFTPPTAQSLLAKPAYLMSQCRLWFRDCYKTGVNGTYKDVWLKYNKEV